MTLDDVLLDAIDSNSLEQVQQCLAQGANPNARRGNKSALARVHHRRDDIRCALIEAGAWSADLLGSLVWAVSTGRPATVQALLKRGSNPNLQAYAGSPLQVAARQGLVEIARLLLAAGADVEAGNSLGSPLQAAIEAQQPEVAVLLLEHDARPNLLGVAAALGQGSVVEALLRRGASPDEVTAQHPQLQLTDFTPLLAVCQAGHLDIVERLLEAGADPHRRDGTGKDALELASPPVRAWLQARGIHSRQSPQQLLLLAAEAGDLQQIQALLALSPAPDLQARDARRDSRGFTPLALASRQGHVQAVDLLLRAGANPEVADADKASPGLKRLVEVAGESALQGEPPGRTPLFWAALGNHALILRMLINAGANPQRLDFLGYHPLFLAAQHGHLDVIEVMLQAGVPVDLPGPSGSTALLEALQHGHRDCALGLLRAGASARTRCKGSTPLMEAAELADADLIRRLLAAGARLTTPKKSSPPLARAAGASHRVPLSQAPPGNWPKLFNEHGAFATVPRPESQVLEAVEALLAAGAKVDEVGWLGPPLMAAARQGQLLVVERLLKAGADPNQLHQGDSALRLAELFGHSQVARRLQAVTGPRPPEQLPPAETDPEVELALPDFRALAESPEFRAVLNELETLCGSRATTRPQLQGAWELHVHSQRRASFSVLEQQRRLLARGFYLFKPGASEQVESVVVLPSPRWQDALALMQTNGINSGQSPAKVLEWMEQLQNQQPFELQTISHDTLAGVFRSPIANPKKLAQQMVRFCPDIVDQGCGTVTALARELRNNPARLFFWWD